MRDYHHPQETKWYVSDITEQDTQTAQGETQPDSRKRSRPGGRWTMAAGKIYSDMVYSVFTSFVVLPGI